MRFSTFRTSMPSRCRRRTKATEPSALKPMRRASRGCIASMDDIPIATIYNMIRLMTYWRRLTRSLISRRMFTSSSLTIVETQFFQEAVRSEGLQTGGRKMVDLRWSMAKCGSTQQPTKLAMPSAYTTTSAMIRTSCRMAARTRTELGCPPATLNSWLCIPTSIPTAQFRLSILRGQPANSFRRVCIRRVQQACPSGSRSALPKGFIR